MKRNLALVLALALLVFSLSACGRDNKTDSGKQDAMTDVNDGAAQDGVIDGGLDSNTPTESSTVPQSKKTVGASYDQMLRNAKVHDNDGDLRDHENAVTPGSSY